MITIRTEREEEKETVENLTRDAFWNLYTPGATEHYVLHKMRDLPEFLPSLSLVAEVEGSVVGHIAFTYSQIIQNESKSHRVLTFGPLSVLPSKQGTGIGSALVRKGIEKARDELGETAIVITGYPHFYRRFGFDSANKYGITMSDGTCLIGLMALELVKGGLDGVTGHFTPSPVFQVEENDCQEFDKKFIAKEKYITKSQQTFQQIIQLKWGDEYDTSFISSMERV
jgi:predicted N-acetyltransferase YhbS